MNKKILLKNFSLSALANGINLMLSILSAFILPKILGIREYAYWQLYVFYTSYIGFFHFGWADGIYLKQGGKKYQELDQADMASQLRLYILFEFIVMIFVIFISLLMVKDQDKQYVLMITGVCLFITLPRTFFQYLLQTTDRISEYASNIIYEKLIYVIGTTCLVIGGIREYRPLLIVDLLAKIVTLFLVGRLCKDILFFKVTRIWDALPEAWDNIHIGIKLMAANIAGLLLVGIVKLSVEMEWGIEVFGKASLTITASNMIMIFISAVSVVLYPVLRNIEMEQLVSIYKKLRLMLVWLTLGCLLFYYPIQHIISMWLPQYVESLKYMALLFPMCVFESKTVMLANTYFKALRKEKILLRINWISVVFAYGFTYVAVKIQQNLGMAMLGLMLSFGFRSTIAELYLSKILQLKIIFHITLEWMIIGMFCYIFWNIGGWKSTICYSFIYTIYSFYIFSFYRETRETK